MSHHQATQIQILLEMASTVRVMPLGAIGAGVGVASDVGLCPHRTPVPDFGVRRDKSQDLYQNEGSSQNVLSKQGKVTEAYLRFQLRYYYIWPTTYT
jgi:hypothetical protein